MYTKAPCHYTLSTKRSFNKSGKINSQKKFLPLSHNHAEKVKFHTVTPFILLIKKKRGFHAQSKYIYKDTVSVPKEFRLQPGKRDKPTCHHPHHPKSSPNISSDMKQIADLHNQLDTLNMQTLPSQIKRLFSPAEKSFKKCCSLYLERCTPC